MFVFFFLIGFLPLLLIGWLAISALEGRARFLSQTERLIYGAILGPTVLMEVVFLFNAAHLFRLNLLGYLVSILLLLVPLGILEWKKRSSPNPNPNPNPKLSKPTIIILSLLGLWFLLKLAAGMTILMSDPAYNDDVFNNWHYRSKILHHEEMLVIHRENPGVTAYPPTVPMIKVWFALVNGEWNDRLAALTSPLWYLLSLALVWCTLKRSIGRSWAILGAYMLASLPLFLIHGFTPYADLFVALHISAALLPLYAALTGNSEQERSAWLRIGALGTALLPMTKNEALLMHFPPILLIAGAVILWCLIHGKLSLRATRSAVLTYAILVTAVLVPWLTYKWMNGLPFGNAKGISGMEIFWQENILRSLFITWVLEANFLLLPGVLFGLLIVRFRTAFFSPVVTLTTFTLTAILGISMIFLFTGLSTEALRQTGSARGIVQLLPVMVVLVTVLMADMYRVFVVRK
ncbi:hypothetical protein A3C37_05285 [Candidatus Peribacteria bacterium RIFCSPHIGHO2_02_FULL_53_20]|nr:MAG: hypothetical protein A3C37_05285 [Candidatus Peribacteria bacterium RIFCSPHIGHO2_02_FULL_53_20]OGJ68245.1 MAG: hypothetical protein A3B61_03715 [Candidatus Peribacteria bacterium RIFCSPLOWO2_01_FULL_53_10]OGJ70239.1 MAG: hypothetical protein A3G69_02150 [Candidatus Peribacteria bacterium RIFCSPLOWO2_12_FULL_53_10]